MPIRAKPRRRKNEGAGVLAPSVAGFLLACVVLDPCSVRDSVGPGVVARTSLALLKSIGSDPLLRSAGVKLTVRISQLLKQLWL